MHRRHQRCYWIIPQGPKNDPSCSDRNFAITFVTLAELVVGVFKADKLDLAWRKIEGVAGDKLVLRVSEMTPIIYARIHYDLERRGVMIPINDIWIATLAIEVGLPLVARDEHFSRIQGLVVIPC